MADFKSMYYHLAGRMATTIDVLETTTKVLEATTKSLEATTKSLESTTSALVELKEKLKLAQQTTEEMFINSCEDCSEESETD